MSGQLTLPFDCFTQTERLSIASPHNELITNYREPLTYVKILNWKPVGRRSNSKQLALFCSWSINTYV